MALRGYHSLNKPASDPAASALRAAPEHGLLERSLRRATPARATSPEPKRIMLPGSGTVDAGGGDVGGSAVITPFAIVPPPLQPLEMVFSSSVTAPVDAKALPHPIVAPVSRVMLERARIFPWNAVVVPRVAEVPTFQNMPSFDPEPVTFTLDPLAVVSVEPTRNTHKALSLPSPLIVSAPVSCADEANS